MFFRLPPMLCRGPNRAHVGGNHCWFTIPYVVPYCCYWEDIGEQFGSPLETLKTPCKLHGNTFKTPWEQQYPKESKLFGNKLLNHPQKYLSTNLGLNLELKVLIKVGHIGPKTIGQ